SRRNRRRFHAQPDRTGIGAIYILTFRDGAPVTILRRHRIPENSPMSDTSSLIDRAGLDRVRVGKLLERGLEGADDGELFLEYKQSEMLVFDNGRLKQATYDTNQGFGLRAVKDEAVGYAHASDVSEPAIARAADAVRAVKGGHSGTYAEAPGRTNVKLYS